MSRDILLVDDDEIFILTASVVLKKAYPGSNILIAKNGEEALKLLDKQSPDLILLDLNMPIMDGWDFLSAAANKPLPPIFIVSSSVDPKEKEKASAMKQVKGFIEKPLDAKKIVGLL